MEQEVGSEELNNSSFLDSSLAARTYEVCTGPISEGERAYLLRRRLALEDSMGELYGEPSTFIDSEDSDASLVMNCVQESGKKASNLSENLGSSVNQDIMTNVHTPSDSEIKSQMSLLDFEEKERNIELYHLESQERQAEISENVNVNEKCAEPPSCSSLADQTDPNQISDKLLLADAGGSETNEEHELSCSGGGENVEEKLAETEAVKQDPAQALEETNEASLSTQALKSATLQSTECPHNEAEEKSGVNSGKISPRSGSPNGSIDNSKNVSAAQNESINTFNYSSSSGEEFNDTITRMEKILAMAEEQERVTKASSVPLENLSTSEKKSPSWSPSSSILKRCKKSLTSIGRTTLKSISPFPKTRSSIVVSAKAATSEDEGLMASPFPDPFRPPCHIGKKGPYFESPALPLGFPKTPNPSTPKPGLMKSFTPPPWFSSKKNYRKDGASAVSSPVAHYIYGIPTPTKIQRAATGNGNSNGREGQIKVGGLGSGSTLSNATKPPLPMMPGPGGLWSPKPSILQESSQQKKTQTQTSANNDEGGPGKQPRLPVKFSLKPVEYHGSDKIRDQVYKIDTPKGNAELKVLIHKGVMDENTNATIVEDESVNKAYVPARLKECKKT